MILVEKIVISCKQATYLHEKKKEGKLDGIERFGLWFHLLYCKFCKLFVKQVEQIESMARKFYKRNENLHLSDTRKSEMQKAFDTELKK